MDDALWNESQCAEFRGCAVSSIQKERLRGDGPPFVKMGRLVRYRPKDVGYAPSVWREDGSNCHNHLQLRYFAATKPQYRGQQVDA